jgi:hypothetical protein
MMPFTIFTNSTTAFANEVMDNFYHIADGDRLPRGAGSMTAIDSTYNLGSSANKWKNLYANNLNLYGDIDSTTLLTKVAQVTFSTNTSSSDFTISGLNGDNADLYFSAHISINGTDTVYMYFNNDTGTNYSFKSLFVDNANLTNNTSSSAVNGFSCFSTFTTRFVFSGEIFSKTGVERVIKLNSNFGHIFYVGVWSNTSATITSIGFYTAGANNFTKFSKITIWEMP